jgi:hypothetical protein
MQAPMRVPDLFEVITAREPMRERDMFGRMLTPLQELALLDMIMTWMTVLVETTRLLVATTSMLDTSGSRVLKRMRVRDRVGALKRRTWTFIFVCVCVCVRNCE